ncbi:F-box only protein 9 isoform X1 [Tachypleus tridentatus]|uniref:F-box only protein 9 isoform X1 n=2 Tax=Tachypleus tridentatus TaxID=6853 RepID=UPI003FCFCEF5
MDELQSRGPGALMPLAEGTAGEQGSSSSGGGDGNGDESGEAQDEESSSSNALVTMETELENFRQEWRRELEESPQFDASGGATRGNTAELSERHKEDIAEEKARRYFLQGINSEQSGRLYEAISFYRRAVQLVPDIEFKMFDNSGKMQTGNGSDSSDDSAVEEEVLNADDVSDLVTKFNNLSAHSGCTLICQPDIDQKTTHISALPREVFMYILRWLVSSDFDFHSLEQVSMVSRGFYLCARDPEIWRLACLRVWDVNCGHPNKYGTWRDMYLQRPRLRFNGAYISRTTYVRYGEAMFQDASYRPCYLVEYYRYLRFFPDGLVFMLTTPDDPYQSLAKLRHRKVRHTTVLTGHYRLLGSFVSIVAKRPKVELPVGSNYFRYRRNKQNLSHDPGEQQYHLKLEVRNIKHRTNFQLLWQYYAIHTKYRNGQETVSSFDLTPKTFPPFWFSRVRSFTTESISPLQ